MDVREMARLGGLARTNSMTAAERRKLATKASRAAAKARKKRARERKADKAPDLPIETLRRVYNKTHPRAK